MLHYRYHGGNMNTKTCSKCGEEKPSTLEYFNKNGNYLRGDCRLCVKQYRQDNLKEINERRRTHYSDKTPEYKEARAEKHKQYYQANREAILGQLKQYRQDKIAEQPACVYQIVNKQSGRIYIGATIRGVLRWNGHIRSLRGNYHANPNLQKDFNKFGEVAFEWSIIKEYPKDRKLLKNKEKQLIEQYEEEGKQLYNYT